VDSEIVPFNSYFVHLSRQENQFSANVDVNGTFFHADFKRIEGAVFSMHFRMQVHFRYSQQCGFRNKKEMFSVLLPILSKYNQRKLKKIAELFNSEAALAFPDILLAILRFDKFMEARRLESFFSLSELEMMTILQRLEIERRIKIIDMQDLLITSQEHFLQVRDDLLKALQKAYECRVKSISFVDLEKQIKIPHSSLFFRYLLRMARERIEFSIAKNRVFLQKLPLTESEKEKMEEIVRILKKNHLQVFSLDELIKVSGFPYASVNEALWNLLQEGHFIQLTEQFFIFSEEFQRIINRLKKYKRNQGDLINIQDFRELTGYTRKSLILLFEYFDMQQITQRVGNSRRILLSA